MGSPGANLSDASRKIRIEKVFGARNRGEEATRAHRSSFTPSRRASSLVIARPPGVSCGQQHFAHLLFGPQGASWENFCPRRVLHGGGVVGNLTPQKSIDRAPPCGCTRGSTRVVEEFPSTKKVGEGHKRPIELGRDVAGHLGGILLVRRCNRILTQAESAHQVVTTPRRPRIPRVQQLWVVEGPMTLCRRADTSQRCNRSTGPSHAPGLQGSLAPPPKGLGP